jgi:apolipoprotein N-acyltransferase
MRGWVFTGFPWAAAGYAHNTAPLGGFAAVLGVYGIGVLAAVCAGCLVMLTQRQRMPALALFGLLIVSGSLLRQVEWTHPAGKPISVRLLQGDIPQDEKFDANHLSNILVRYRDMLTATPADLTAAPETAIPVFPQQLPPGYLDIFRDYAARTGTTFLYGIPLADSPTVYANSVAGVDPQGRGYRYDKQHLVPFGEFIPTGFRWFTDLMQIPLGDFTRGAAVQAPFAVKDQLVLPNVCYEDVFGDEIARTCALRAASGHAAAERVEPGLVRRIDGDPAAPADLAHALAGDGPPDAARDQQRRHRHHRRARRDPGTDSVLRPGRAGGHGAGHDRRHAVYPLRQPGLPGPGRAGAAGRLAGGRKRRGA